MDPNQNSALLEALARRAGPNGSPAGGGIPALQQRMGGAVDAIPAASGIPNVAPRAGATGQPQAVPNNPAAAAQAATGPQFDAETRDLAKQLIARLVKGI